MKSLKFDKVVGTYQDIIKWFQLELHDKLIVHLIKLMMQWFQCEWKRATLQNTESQRGERKCKH